MEYQNKYRCNNLLIEKKGRLGEPLTNFISIFSLPSSTGKRRERNGCESRP